MAHQVSPAHGSVLMPQSNEDQFKHQASEQNRGILKDFVSNFNYMYMCVLGCGFVHAECSAYRGGRRMRVLDPNSGPLQVHFAL